MFPTRVEQPPTRDTEWRIHKIEDRVDAIPEESSDTASHTTEQIEPRTGKGVKFVFSEFC